MGIFMDFFFLCTTLLHLPPLRFHCVQGCWDRTQDSCDYDIGCMSDALTTRLNLIHNRLDLIHSRLDLIYATKNNDIANNYDITSII
jgi:hypothetical protein